MDRRNALKNLGILSGSLLMFPSCDFSKEKVAFSLNKLNIKESEEALMKELVSCIIPEGEFPGASSLNVGGFVWIMVDDCLDEPSQNSFMNGLRLFDDSINQLTGKSFMKLTQENRVKALIELNQSAEKNDSPDHTDLDNFVQTTKRFTALGYMNSEYIMTEVMPYSLVPGTYGLCETIDYTKRININA